MVFLHKSLSNEALTEQHENNVGVCRVHCCASQLRDGLTASGIILLSQTHYMLMVSYPVLLLVVAVVVP